MKRLIAIVGLPGSGKTEVAEYIKRKIEAGYIRLGQLTLDEIMRKKLKPTEENERKIRERFRKKYGMAAYAVLNFSKIDKILKTKDNIIIDGLYSWEEYLEFEKRYSKELIVVAVYASPKTRYNRLINRSKKYKNDEKLQFRSFSLQEAQSRDYAEIENINKAGPIAMADYMIVNEGGIDELQERVDKIMRKNKW